MIRSEWQPSPPIDGDDVDMVEHAAIVARFREVQAEKTLAPSPNAKKRPAAPKAIESDLSHLDDDPAIVKVRAEMASEKYGWNIRYHESGHRRGGRVPRTEVGPDGLSPKQRRTLEVARALAGGGETVAIAAVARELGVTPRAVAHQKRRIAAIGLWPWRSPAPGRPPRSPKRSVSAEPCESAPALAPAAIAETNGRHHRDDGDGIKRIVSAIESLAAALRPIPASVRRPLCDLAILLAEGVAS